MNLLTDKEVAKKLSIHQCTVWHWARNKPDFSKPIKLYRMTTRWVEEEIEEWVLAHRQPSLEQRDPLEGR